MPRCTKTSAIGKGNGARLRQRRSEVDSGLLQLRLDRGRHAQHVRVGMGESGHREAHGRGLARRTRQRYGAAVEKIHHRRIAQHERIGRREVRGVGFERRDRGWTRLPALGASDALRMIIKLQTIYARLMKNSLRSNEAGMNARVGLGS